MKKGIIFTLDATLAVIMALSLIIPSLFYLSKSDVTFEQENLYRITTDSLAILEKNDVLMMGVLTNSSLLLQEFLDSLPYNVCAKVELFNKDGEKQLTVLKEDCTYSEDYQVVRRVFLAQESIYLARMETWYR